MHEHCTSLHLVRLEWAPRTLVYESSRVWAHETQEDRPVQASDIETGSVPVT